MLTRQQLTDQIARAQATIDQWNEMPEESAPLVNWRGAERKTISEAVANAWADLIDLCDTAEAEMEAKPLVLAIDRFEHTLADWSQGIEIDASNTDPAGSHQLWNAWSAIGDVKPLKIVYPESIKTLIEVQGVSDRQIALQYGFADVRMVREEYEKPGTHYDRKTWTSPAYRRKVEQTEKEWSERTKRNRYANPSKPKPAKIAPESIDSLIEQRVPSAQIARMKGVSVEQVKERADFLGMPIDGQLPSLAASPADRLAEMRRQEDEQFQRAKSAGQRGPHAEIDNVVERVAACAVDGMKPGEIASALKNEYPGLTGAKVAKMLESPAVK
jgi:hypothetical protein